ncbi:MAG: hypothetical protein EXR63_04035 [Dehalococcoidia bacterium]|nr:hypothetical protein [Dehalococcoidia bacterium]
MAARPTPRPLSHPSARAAEQILVCGWDDALPPLLRALDREAGLRACAIGDARPAQLIRARQATGAPCYQHVREMLRVAEADVVLAASARSAAGATERAAARAQDLLLFGPAMDGDALAAAATAVARHGAACFVLRPALRSAGFAYLVELLAADSGWQPRALEIALAGPAGPEALLRDAVAAATALIPLEPVEAIASFAGASRATASTFAVQLRYYDGRLVTLTARDAAEPRLRVAIDAHAGRAEVRTSAGESDLELALTGVDVQHLLLRDRDLYALEARRVASARARRADDSASLPAEATTLRAIEAALDSGLTQAVAEFAPRPALRLLSGRARVATPPSGQLHLVPS